MRTTQPPPPPPAPPPHSPFGHYKLLNRIAVGGMAEVFRALEPRGAGEPRVVVVKRMLPSLAADAEARALFESEARIGARIHHPNVVELLGSGAAAGQPFLALEFVPGADLWRLGRWLTRRGRTLGAPLSVYVTRQMLAGLQAIHEARDESGAPLHVVHRDVSPSNVLLSVHGDVKLGDLGIAKSMMREKRPQAPLGGHAKGKLGYLSPEQVRGADVDLRADIFSVGVVAAEMLMGRPLFAGGSELAVLLAIRDGKIQPFLELGPALPKGLVDVVARALASHAEHRWTTAAELRDALAPFEQVDPEKLRDALAELVQMVMQATDPSDTFARPTPVDLSVSAIAAADDARPTAVPAQPSYPQQPKEATTGLPPRTSSQPALEYRLRLASGEDRGLLTYARLVEQIATGQVGPEDLVSAGGGAFHSVYESTELRRHLPPSTLTPTTRGHGLPAEPDSVASLENGGIISVLARAIIREETALLLCEHGGVRKEVYLARGVPEFVTSNLAGELLGEYLVKKDIISRGELDMALAVMPRFEGKLGDTLAALGLVEPVHLFRHIADQVREKLLDIFLWTGGKASQYRGTHAPTAGFPLGLDAWRLILDGIRMRIEHGMEDQRLAGRDGIALERVPDVADNLLSGYMPSEVRGVLNLMQRPASPTEIRARLSSPGGRDEWRSLGAIVLLLQLGAIRWTA